MGLLRGLLVVISSVALGACQRGSPAASAPVDAGCADADACFTQAEATLSRPGQRQAATSLFERACQLGSSKACARLAVRPGAQGEQRANAQNQLPKLVPACEHGDAEACELAASLDGGATLGVQALTLHRAGCEASSAARCLRAAQLLDQGQLVERDQAGARVLFQRGCDLGLPGACAELGLKYLRGDGVEADPSRAAPLMRRARALLGPSPALDAGPSQ